MSELEKMINGEFYKATDLKLVFLRDKASRILNKYNKKVYHEYNLRNNILPKLINTKGNYIIKPPFFCDYGFNIYIGKNVMVNYNCTFLDVCKIEIGDNTLIGPNTGIYTACHPVDKDDRLNGLEYGKSIKIGNNVWIGGNCTILPGVTIGDNTVIGAGSVVTKSIESNVVAYGNPCEVKRKIEKE